MPARTPLQGGILLLQRRAGLVQGLSNIGGLSLDGAPARTVRDEELMLVRVSPGHRLGHALSNELLRLLLEPVRQTLQEEKTENIGLVVAAIGWTRAGLSAADQRYCSSWVTLSLFACKWRVFITVGDIGGSPTTALFFRAGVGRGNHAAKLASLHSSSEISPAGPDFRQGFPSQYCPSPNRRACGSFGDLSLPAAL